MEPKIVEVVNKDHALTASHQTTFIKDVESPHHQGPTAVKPADQKKRTKLGFVTKHVLVSNAAWEKIQSHLDNECLDEGKWLTRQFDLFAETLEIK